MIGKTPVHLRDWAIAAGMGVTAGLAVWWVGSPYAHSRWRADGLDTSSAAAVSVLAPADSIPWRYAKAVQEGDCEEVLRMTWWMIGRMQYVQAESSSPTSLETVREELCRQIQERHLEGIWLKPEGVEDHYIFAPGAILEPSFVDSGRDDLAKPVHNRVWIRVIYPDQVSALLSEEGRPIRSITVGVNVSNDGYVLKAGVVGNLDIDWNSIEYDWE